MTGFQVAGVGMTALLAGLTGVRLLRRRLPLRSGSAWFLLWSAAAAAIAWPQATVAIARLVGIGRGADLVFYCSLLAILGGFFAVYTRLRRVEASITALVRHLAMTELPDAIVTVEHETGDE